MGLRTRAHEWLEQIVEERMTEQEYSGETLVVAEALVKRLSPVSRPPTSTYRVQLNAGFTFRDATRIVPYLAKLGIGALYTSPFFKASPSSTHGYDVVDYGALNPEIGTEADFERLVAALREHGMGLVVDFVPNHMGI